MTRALKRHAMINSRFLDRLLTRSTHRIPSQSSQTKDASSVLSPLAAFLPFFCFAFLSQRRRFFPFLSFPFLSFPFLSFPFLSFPFLPLLSFLFLSLTSSHAAGEKREEIPCCHLRDFGSNFPSLLALHRSRLSTAPSNGLGSWWLYWFYYCDHPLWWLGGQVARNCVSLLRG